MQRDNYALREYVIQLQSRMLDLQIECPPPPPNININPPAGAGARPGAARESQADPPTTAGSAGALADVAAAVADLRARERASDGLYPKPAFSGGDVKRDSEDEMRRHMQPDKRPSSSLRA